jgi:hypothetical protein
VFQEGREILVILENRVNGVILVFQEGGVILVH